MKRLLLGILFVVLLFFTFANAQEKDCASLAQLNTKRENGENSNQENQQERRALAKKQVKRHKDIAREQLIREILDQQLARCIEAKETEKGN
jgi:hypothetical protein